MVARILICTAIFGLSSVAYASDLLWICDKPPVNNSAECTRAGKDAFAKWGCHFSGLEGGDFCILISQNQKEGAAKDSWRCQSLSSDCDLADFSKKKPSCDEGTRFRKIEISDPRVKATPSGICFGHVSGGKPD
jgi:hypothetical protein